MAEKYGTIPKRFTKKWWGYFWDYYKFHTIVITLIIIAVTYTVYTKVTEPKYDLTINYVGNDVIVQENLEKIEEEISAITTDVNKNGQSLADVRDLIFPVENTADSYANAMHTKVQLSIAADEIYLYITDKSHLTVYATDTIENCPFAPVSQWLEGDLKLSRYSVGGEDVAVSLAGNKFFESLGINTDEKYLCMRYYPRENQKKQLEGYKASVELANKILKNEGN